MDFDSIDTRTAFKLGVLSYCADRGMSKEATEEFVKSAFLPALAGAASAAWPYVATALATGGGMMLLNGASTGGKELLKLDTMLPVAGGLIGGAGLGWGAAKLNEPDITPDEIKARELTDTYKRYTDRLKARQAYQQYRSSRQMA